MTHPEQMFQVAPYPHNLVDVVNGVAYKDWAFNVHTYERPGECEGLTLRIRIPEVDVYDPDRTLFWIHEFDVPARVAEDEVWSRWVFDCIILTHTHEAMEQFLVHAERLFAPDHHLRKDMYAIRHRVFKHSIGGS